MEDTSTKIGSRAYFQFDNNPPEQIATIEEGCDFDLKMSLPEGQDETFIEFTSSKNTGSKKFKLILKRANEEV